MQQYTENDTFEENLLHLNRWLLTYGLSDAGDRRDRLEFDLDADGEYVRLEDVISLYRSQLK